MLIRTDEIWLYAYNDDTPTRRKERERHVFARKLTVWDYVFCKICHDLSLSLVGSKNLCNPQIISIFESIFNSKLAAEVAYLPGFVCQTISFWGYENSLRIYKNVPFGHFFAAFLKESRNINRLTGTRCNLLHRDYAEETTVQVISDYQHSRYEI